MNTRDLIFRNDVINNQKGSQTGFGNIARETIELFTALGARVACSRYSSLQVINSKFITAHSPENVQTGSLVN